MSAVLTFRRDQIVPLDCGLGSPGIVDLVRRSFEEEYPLICSSVRRAASEVASMNTLPKP